MTLADIQITFQNSVVVAELTGEIDLSNARGIQEAIAVATPNDATLAVLDLSQLDYLDSAGIQLIYQVREKLQVRGQRLSLVFPADSPASDALRLAGVLDYLDVFQTVSEALAQAPPPPGAEALAQPEVTDPAEARVAGAGKRVED